MELVVAIAFLLAPLSPAQAHVRTADAADIVLVGRVVASDGLPEPAAQVTSSAGGETLAAADGTFELAIRVPLDAECLDVTAVATQRGRRGEQTATARVVPSSLAPITSVGTLLLAPAPDCAPRWLPEFGGRPGVDNIVWTLATFDDGTGAALYAAGAFDFAGGARTRRIAKLDGSRWYALGSGLNDVARALAVFDDGSGAALYVGGDFTTAGGAPANGIARWDGASWTALGTGIPGSVRALAAWDDGNGAGLYVGGEFTSAGGVAVNRIARWDGVGWTPLGSGVDASVTALTAFDDGTGPALFAGGNFTTAGGSVANYIAKWDGTSWAPLGSGMNFPVHALTVFDDGNGARLYAGGFFTSAGGVPANRIAGWDGTSWSALGSGLNSSAFALAVLDDGSGPALHAAGVFTSAGGSPANFIARWDGASWSALGSGLCCAISVRALAVVDRGGGTPELYAGGDFTNPSLRVARWDGASWSAPTPGLTNRVAALAVFDDGGGTKLYAGGSSGLIGGDFWSVIAAWDGTRWSSVGSGPGGPVRALAVFDDGSGPALYAGGEGSLDVAKWNGSSWSDLPGVGGSNDSVRALAVFDDGNGPALYAAGLFTTAGGVPANRIARWDGASWTALGSGMSSGDVSALAVFDDGSGPALYAGGDFGNAGGVSTPHIARWDGASWTSVGPVGTGTNAAVLALVVFDDGSGPALFAGGHFTRAGGVLGSFRVARWDGASWTMLGSGLNDTCTGLGVFDDGTGPALYVGGEFSTAGGVASRGIARWDGSTWNALGSGLDGPGFSFTANAFAAFDEGNGPALHVGGTFYVSPTGDSFLAKWGCPQRIRREQ